MRLPFSTEQFFAVFAEYNVAVWQAQFALLFLGLMAVGLVLWPPAQSGFIVSAILAALWAWLGLVYHLLFFTRINPLAFAFAAVSLAGALAFLWWGVFRRKLRFERPVGWRTWVGGGLLIYALLLYPALSWLAGHHYPTLPTFGLPCPTTIFTFGVLAFLARPYPWQVFVVPALWSVMGGQAAFLLSVPQDLGLLVAGILGLMLALGSRSGISHEHSSSSGRSQPAG
jgi:hypothetical protein